MDVAPVHRAALKHQPHVPRAQALHDLPLLVRPHALQYLVHVLAVREAREQRHDGGTAVGLVPQRVDDAEQVRGRHVVRRGKALQCDAYLWAGGGSSTRTVRLVSQAGC